MLFEQWDTVAVPFPFTDQSHSKPRPALVLSPRHFHTQSRHIICAMITSAQRSRWETDIPISDLSVAGLKHASLIRFKIFTLDAALPLRTLGTLPQPDRPGVTRQLGALFPQTEIWH